MPFQKSISSVKAFKPLKVHLHIQFWSAFMHSASLSFDPENAPLSTRVVQKLHHKNARANGA